MVGSDILSVALYEDIRAECPNTRFYFADDLIQNIRAQKNEYELGIMRTGAQISDEVAAELRQHLLLVNLVSGQRRYIILRPVIESCKTAIL